MPQVNMLQVSQQVRSETIPILCGKNVWQMPSHRHTSINTYEYYRNMFVTHQVHFRQITVYFDRRDEAHASMQADLLDIQGATYYQQGSGRQERMEIIHDRQIRSLCASFFFSGDMLTKLMPHLSNLTVDVRHLNCPQRCCRQQIMAGIFQDLFVKQIAPAACFGSGVIRIKFRDLQSSEEDKLVYED